MKINSCIISGATNESSPPNLIVLYTQITATAPFYSTQAMVEPTSVSQNNPYKLYTLSCHYIQLQCTRKRMHTSLLGRMPGPRRPIHVRLCIKKNQNAPILSEHPPVRRKIVKTFRWDQRLQIQKEKLERAYTSPARGEKMSKRLGGNVGCCCAIIIVKEGALVSPKGSHWAGPEKYRSTVCQSGPSKRAH